MCESVCFGIENVVKCWDFFSILGDVVRGC